MHDNHDLAVPAHPYGEDIKNVLITEDDLQARIQEMADRVSEKYRNTDEGLILVCVLKGAVFFLTDFARKLAIPSQLEFMAVSSYGNSASSSGVVRILKDLDRDIEGRDVVIVEDIIDSGLTMQYLLNNLASRGAASLRVCTLLDKPERRLTDVRADYTGFAVPNEFVVGYGLDYNQTYRNLPDIGVLHPEIYTKAGE